LRILSDSPLDFPIPKSQDFFFSSPTYSWLSAFAFFFLIQSFGSPKAADFFYRRTADTVWQISGRHFSLLLFTYTPPPPTVKTLLSRMAVLVRILTFFSWSVAQCFTITSSVALHRWRLMPYPFFSCYCPPVESCPLSVFSLLLATSGLSGSFYAPPFPSLTPSPNIVAREKFKNSRFRPPCSFLAFPSLKFLYYPLFPRVFSRPPPKGSIFPLYLQPGRTFRFYS